MSKVQTEPRRFSDAGKDDTDQKTFFDEPTWSPRIREYRFAVGGRAAG